MSEKEKSFSPVLKCGHCGNRAPMEIVTTYSQLNDSEYNDGIPCEEGDIYELMLCPACKNVLLYSYYWWSDFSGDIYEGDIPYVMIYPSISNIPFGLPKKIHMAYDSALKVRSDPNAYAVLIGRVLEMVCLDRNAIGDNLFNKLDDLAKKGEIPDKLVGVAHSLRKLRNIGAHAYSGELTPAEVPILEALCKAILEYVYSAPYLVKQAEERLEALRKANSPKNNV